MLFTSVIRIPIAIEAKVIDGRALVQQILEKATNSPKLIAEGISIRAEDKSLFVSKGLPPEVVQFTLQIGKEVSIAMGAAIVCAFILEKLKDKAKSIREIRIGDKIVGLSGEDIEKALIEQIQAARTLEGPARQ